MDGGASMSDKNVAKQRSETLKHLRAEHAESVERMQARLKEHRKIHKAICQSIRAEAKTVPEIAQELEMPTHEVLWYLTAYKKYDMVMEDGMCGAYVLYKRVEEK
jgi:predicted Rossmann fold nucleotide-binding protein DprA/Smf involved in DNA uptake